jgi:hypothetical protein
MNIPEICNKSKTYIENTFGSYKKIDALPSKDGRVVIHLYPVQDTANDVDDYLEGYEDAFLCKARLYYPDSNEYFESERLHDAISIDSSVRVTVRVFKDGSTCLACSSPVHVGLYQCLEIYNREEIKRPIDSLHWRS